MMTNSNENGEKIQNKEDCLTVDVVLTPSMVKFFNLRPAKYEFELEYIKIFYIRFINVWGFTLGIDDIRDVNAIMVVARFEMHNKASFNRRLQCWTQQNMIKPIRLPTRQPSDEELCTILDIRQDQHVVNNNEIVENNNENGSVAVYTRRSKFKWIRALCCLSIIIFFI